MINLDQYDLFAENKTTLKQASMDDSAGEDGIQYMTESQMEVVDFDMVKRRYANRQGCSEECAASVDALFSMGDHITFAEFKNGKVNNRNVKDKIRDSLLIFSDITKKTASYTREHADLVLVYNQEKNPGSKRIKEDELPVSPSRVTIGNWVCAKAGRELVLFDIGKYAPIYFRAVHTYTVEQFEEYLRKNS